MTDTHTLTAAQDRPPIVVLRERFETRRDELKNALPSDVPPERFIRAVMTSAQLNPEILACSWQSIWLASLQACRDGLIPDGVEGAIVPFKGRATWIAMYQGLLRRFRRSGQFKWVTANVVRQDEVFSHYIDETGEHIHHVPGDSIAAPIVKIYAMATTKDGGLFVTVLPIAEANKVRSQSRATRDDGPWKMWAEEMYKKTAIRRLSKYLPSARDLIGDDDLPEQPADDPSPPELLPRRSAGAAAALQQFAGSPEPSPKGAPIADPASAAATVRRAEAAVAEEGGGEVADATASEDALSAATGTASNAPAATDPPSGRRSHKG